MIGARYGIAAGAPVIVHTTNGGRAHGRWIEEEDFRLTIETQPSVRVSWPKVVVTKVEVQKDNCPLCGEEIVADEFGYPVGEVGEFWDAAAEDSVIAHAQCGVDAGMELA